MFTTSVSRQYAKIGAVKLLRKRKSDSWRGRETHKKKEDGRKEIDIQKLKEQRQKYRKVEGNTENERGNVGKRERK